MPQVYAKSRKGILLLLVLILFRHLAFSQAEADTTLTPRFIATGPNSNGFYEYLPKGYVEGTASYPLIVALHGISELGNGTTQLPNILDDGIPMYITQHLFPETVTVDGQTSSFIVILPQFVAWPVATDVDDVITYAQQHYRVDKNRIYLTGLSMGGGAVWDYASTSTTFASNLAAIFVVAGAKAMNAQGAANIAKSNLPVFATNNSADPTVPDTVTINNVDLINSSVPPPAIKAIDTIFDATGHDAWTKSYDPSTIYDNGLNAYQWMLRYSRSVSTPLPLSLISYTATLAANDAGVDIDWETAAEQDNKYFVLQRSGDGRSFDDLDTVAPASPNSSTSRSYSYVDRSPLEGENFYRLTGVDENGDVHYYGIREVSLSFAKPAASISPNPCTDHVVVQWNDPALGSLAVDVIDTRGRTIHRWMEQKQQPDWRGTFAVGDLPPGQYFLQLTVNHSRRVETFIKR
ncbi:MAG TPA: T9SS type A sorting domain-containing protein [Puia sp.]|nr:T9SS type A sorting domain-containing protein [Puia sp.]